MSNKTIVSTVCVFMMFFLSCQTADKPSQQIDLSKPRVDPELKGGPNITRLFIVGDSTVKNHKANADGWGDYIGNFFDLNRIDVVNWAYGGRSSRSFIEEGRWAKVLAQLKPGDFVMAQFGHNDQRPITSERGTIPGIGGESKQVICDETKKQTIVHTYGWYLGQYVRDVNAKGATLIFVSPVPRNRWDDKGRFRNIMRDHADWMKQVAEQNGVYFLDLNAILAKHYDRLGKDKVTQRYFNTGDGTHTGMVGAQRNAKAVVQGLKKLKDCELTKYLK
jgi:rhamnogalacturonan acetylesterase